MHNHDWYAWPVYNRDYNMEFTTETLPGDITCIRLTGRLDNAGSQAIENPLAFATTTRAGKFVLDLSAVEFLASIGIRLLVTTARGQTQRGGRIVFAAPQPMVRKVLETTGIDKMITLTETLDEAVASLNA